MEKLLPVPSPRFHSGDSFGVMLTASWGVSHGFSSAWCFARAVAFGVRSRYYQCIIEEVLAFNGCWYVVFRITPSLSGCVSIC